MKLFFSIMATSNINNKALKGVFWTAYNKGGSMVLSFINNIILARLLTPDDFGIIGMVMVFIYLSDVFVQSGFGSALIQKQAPSNNDYCTVFLWNLSIAIILYLILFFTAPFIADFYDINSLTNIVRIISLILIINALSNIQGIILRKELEFKKLANFFIIASIIALILSIISAYKGLGVWSLIIFQLTQGGVNTVLLWVSSKWYPKLIWCKDSFKNLFSFGSFILLASLISMINKQAQSLFIGKLFSANVLGYFTQAKNLEASVTNISHTVIGQVSYPYFSKLQNNQPELIKKYFKVTSIIAFLVCPAMSILIIIAEPLFKLLYSDKWLPSVPFFQILCIMGMIMPLTDITYYLIASIGKSKSLFYRTIIVALSGLSLITGGSFIGINGLVGGITINAYVAYFLYYPIIKSHLNIKFLDILKPIYLPYIFCIIGFGLIILLSYIFLDNLPYEVSYLLKFIIFAFTYVTLAKITNASPLIFILKKIKNGQNLLRSRFYNK